MAFKGFSQTTTKIYHYSLRPWPWACWGNAGREGWGRPRTDPRWSGVLRPKSALASQSWFVSWPIQEKAGIWLKPRNTETVASERSTTRPLACPHVSEVSARLVWVWKKNHWQKFQESIHLNKSWWSRWVVGRTLLILGFSFIYFLFFVDGFLFLNKIHIVAKLHAIDYFSIVTAALNLVISLCFYKHKDHFF